MDTKAWVDFINANAPLGIHYVLIFRDETEAQDDGGVRTGVALNCHPTVAEKVTAEVLNKWSELGFDNALEAS